MSNDVAAWLAKPCGRRTWKKSIGSAPDADWLPRTICWTAASAAVPALVDDSGWLFARAQASNSDAVMALSLGRAPNRSVPESPGTVLNTGWLSALIMSTRNCPCHFPRAWNDFWIDTSKYCCSGPRTSSVRGAFPSVPFAGRMNAAGLMYGSHRLLTGHARVHSGLT